MLTLETLGFLGRFKTFSAEALDLSKVAKMYLWEKDDELYSKDIYQLAIKHARHDVAKAVRGSLAHSRRVGAFLAGIAALRHTKATRPFYWKLEGKILADSIGNEERYYPPSSDSMFVREV